MAGRGGTEVPPLFMKESMYDTLKDIFDNINDFLKFAEAKHAALIALNSAIIFGFLKVYADYKGHSDLKTLIFTVLLCIGTSLLFSFLSFFPKTKNLIKPISNKTQQRNIFFYEHLAELTLEEFIEECNSLKDSRTGITRIERDLMNQILVNSRITSNKYFLFKFALCATAVGCIIPGIYILFKTFCH